MTETTQTQLNWSSDLDALMSSRGPKLVAFFADTVDAQTLVIAQTAKHRDQRILQCCTSGIWLNWLQPYAWAELTYPTPNNV